VQEEFLVEKLPFLAFYCANLSLKIINVRSMFEREGWLKESLFVSLVCLTKKLIVDSCYYVLDVQKYLTYFAIIVCVDIGLYHLAKTGIKPKRIMENRPIMTIIKVFNGLGEAIALEKLIWKNREMGWHHDVAMLLYITLESFINPCLFKLFNKPQTKYLGNIKKSLTFTSLLSTIHVMSKFNDYGTIIDIRRYFGMRTSIAFTIRTGVRLVSCFGYLALLLYDLVIVSFSDETPKKTNFEAAAKEWVKKGQINPLRQLSDTSSEDMNEEERRESFLKSPDVKKLKRE
jgi:hypothetical protein